MDYKALKVLEYDKVLDRLSEFASSDMSKELISDLKPITDMDKIIHMQKTTTEAVSMIIKKGSPPIGGLSDIRGAVKRAEIDAVLSLKELLDIAQSLRIARVMKRYVGEERREETYPILDNQFDGLCTIKKLEDEITSCILSEEEISDNASSQLSSIRRHIRNVNNKIKELLNSIIHSPKYQKYLQDPIVTMRGERYVVPVKSEHKSDMAGVVHDSSSSGATLFIEPIAVVEANNELRQLKLKEKQEIERILYELSQMVGQHTTELKANITILVDLDIVFSKAKLSLDWNAVEPIINNRGYMNIKKARHPLLDRKTVVATDIYLGGEFDTLVITGPNTGGKTVTLKTIGLFTLMAQAGLHVPALDGTELAVFKKVFADIGDEQSIEQSLSTFSSHMTNIVNILKNVDEDSLVLFDELGAGTDPVEGAALAMSILEYLRQVGARTSATTHYSELKLFALSTKGIENASCEFDVETLSPTYKLLIGVPGKSNAFAISSRLGLSQNIIERAKEFISQEDVKFEDIISNLEKNRQIAEQEKEIAIKYKREIEELKKQITSQKERLEAQKDKMLQEARRQARKIIQDAKDEAEDTIKDIRKIQEETQEKERNKELEKARTKLRDSLNKIDESLTTSIIPKKRYSKPPKNLKPGDPVLIINLNQKGNVISFAEGNDEAQIQVGIMKINVHISNLRVIDEKQEKSGTNTGLGKIRMQKSANISTELDLRGQLLDEALLNTDKFLDDASLAGLQQVTIIHGKGTGALKNGIHIMLRTHRHVKSFRLGKYGEGESGVTIIELK